MCYLQLKLFVIKDIFERNNLLNIKLKDRKIFFFILNNLLIKGFTYMDKKT